MLINTKEFLPDNDYVLLVKYVFKSLNENFLKLIFVNITRK